MLLMYPCVMFPYWPGTQYVFCFIIEKSLFAHNISCVSFSLSHLGSLSIWCSLESNKIYWIWLHFIFLNDCVNPRAYGDGLHMSFSELYILTMIVDFATVNNVQWWQLNVPMGIIFFECFPFCSLFYLLYCCVCAMCALLALKVSDTSALLSMRWPTHLDTSIFLS